MPLPANEADTSNQGRYQSVDILVAARLQA